MASCRSAFLVGLAFFLITLVQRGFGDFDGFTFEDKMKGISSVKQRWERDITTTTRRPGIPRVPANPAGGDLSLADALDDPDDGHRKPEPGGGGARGGGGDGRNRLTTTTTKKPAVTQAPASLPGGDFDLADALDDRSDLDDGLLKPGGEGGGGFSDKDLEDVLGGGDYKPDRNKGGGGYSSDDDPGSGMSAETGTVAGVASALAMALIGAVSSYISYQQKKLCFSIQHAADGQEGLSADYVKGENLEAVVCEEPPQVKYSAPTQLAEPPAEQPRI